MGSLHTFEKDTGPDEDNHDWLGVVMLGTSDGSPAPLAGDLGEVSIYDIAPTVLELMGLDVPSQMIGKSILPGG